MVNKSLVTRENTWEDDLAKWSDYALSMSRLLLCIDYAQEFIIKMSKHLSPEDRIQMAECTSKYDELYWKYFQKFINRVRGF